MALLGYWPSRPMVVTQTSGAGAAQTITLAAATEQCHALYSIHCTYTASATQTVTIVFTQNGTATTVVYAIAFTAGVLATIPLEDHLVGDPGTVLTITANLQAGQTSTLVVFYS